MATLQDIIAKRKELGEGATNVDARKALTATASPPPQAPVPEPITPSAPNPAISALPVQPTGGATIPIAKPEITPAPTPTPTPVPEVKPQEPVKPVTPVKEAIDYTQGAGREAEINKNLNEFYNQGTTDPESLKKMSGYAEATPEKKAIIDSFISAKAPNADWLFQSLRSGAPVAPSLQNTPEYKQAQARYNKLQTYQRYSPSQVTTALRTGDIIPGTKEYNDLYTDPAVKAKIDEANAFAVINGGYDFEAIGTKKTSELISQNTNVSNALSDGYISEEELVNMTNTQEVIARATDYQTKADLYTQKKTEFDNIEKTVRADMDKLGLSSFSSVVNARVAEAREALLPELTIAQNEMNTSYGIYTDAKAQALSVVDRNIALYQEERKFAQQKEMIQYQADVGLQTQQREFEQGLEQQAQLASDPVTGVNNIVDTFEKMGIFADRSRQEMVQEVQSKMAQGMTVGEALSDLQAAFKSKPEYQRQLDMTLGQLSEKEKLDAQIKQQDRSYAQELAIGSIRFGQELEKMKAEYDLTNEKGLIEYRRDLIKGGMSETQADAIVRNETGDWNGVTGEKLLYAKDGTFIKSTLPETTNPNGGIECAEYISKMIGSKVGSTWEEKLARNTETTGGVGSIVVWQPAKTGPLAKYGHAGIIVNDLGDSWEVKSANYNLDGRITTDTIPKSEDMRYRSTKLGEKMQGGETQYNDSNIELLAELANMDASARNTALKAQGIPLSAVTDYMAKAKAGLIPPTESQKQSAIATLSNIQGIAETDWNDAVGKYDYSRGMGLQDAENSRVLIDNVRDAAALNNLGLLKGPMSDKDIAFLKSVSSKLDPVQSNAQFEKNMVEMYNIAARKAGVTEISKLSDIPKERIIPGQPTNTAQPTAGGEADYTQFF